MSHQKFLGVGIFWKSGSELKNALLDVTMYDPRIRLSPRHDVVAELSVLESHNRQGDKLHGTLELMPTRPSDAQPFMILTLGGDVM